jgi:poly(3-hydroxybutyrate) depolymerase
MVAADRNLLALVMGAAVLALPMNGRADQTVYFRHADEQLLLADQKLSGAVFFDEKLAAGRAVPLIVFLHGTNESGELHLWLGGGERDLRPLASELMRSRRAPPFVLAAPSQTRGAAQPRALWNSFDLTRFVFDVERATTGQIKIDRGKVVLVGHSGAGCNPTGGLAGNPSEGIKAAALVSIDPCLDAELGAVFARRPPTLPLTVFWQSAVWARSPEQFWAALTTDKPAQRVDRMTKLAVAGATAHDAIVPLALERVVRALPR